MIPPHAPVLEPLDPAKLRFSVVGPGKVGRSLTAWLRALGASPVGLAGRRIDTASRERAASLGARAVALEQVGEESEDLVLVAVDDGALDAVASRLAQGSFRGVALHTSGSRDASALAPLAEAGAATGSLHPLKAFPTPLLEARHAAGSVFAIDGEPRARELARTLATAWGGIAIDVPAEARSLYHFAATWAAGGVVSLVAAAADLAQRAGVPPQVSGGYLELARGALEGAAAAASPAAAITGPIARGDAPTVAAQLRHLAAEAPDALPLALNLARMTLRLVDEAMPEITRIELATLLDGLSTPTSEAQEQRKVERREERGKPSDIEA